MRQRRVRSYLLPGLLLATAGLAAARLREKQPEDGFGEFPIFRLPGNGCVEYALQGDGAPLVFITGIAGKKEPLLLHQAPFFSQRYRFLTYDLRPAALDGRYDIALLAQDLAALMDALDMPDAIICGQSYGALIALQFALDQPARTRSLVLANGFPHYSFEHFGLNSTTLLNLLAMPATVLPPRPVAERAARFLAARHIWVYDDVDGGRATVDFAMRFLRTGPRAVMPRRIKSVLEFDARDRLGSVRAPTLVIAGETDTYCSPAWSEQMARAIPGAQFALIRGAGHLACLSKPDEFNGLIQGFLDGIAPAAAETPAALMPTPA